MLDIIHQFPGFLLLAVLHIHTGQPCQQPVSLRLELRQLPTPLFLLGPVAAVKPDQLLYPFHRQQVLTPGGIDCNARKLLQHKAVKGVLKGKACILAGHFLLQYLLAGQAKHLRLPDAVFLQLVSHIADYSLCFPCILRQINGIDNEEHLVQGKGVLDTPQLNEEFPVRPAESMVVIGHEQHHIRLADVIKGHIGMPGIDGISPRRVHQGNAQPGKRAVIVNCQPVHKAGLILLCRIDAKISQLPGQLLPKFSGCLLPAGDKGTQKGLFPLAAAGLVLQSVFHHGQRLLQGGSRLVKCRQRPVHICQQHGFILQLDHNRAMRMLIIHRAYLIDSCRGRVWRYRQQRLPQEGIGKRGLACAEGTEKRHHEAPALQAVSPFRQLCGKLLQYRDAACQTAAPAQLLRPAMKQCLAALFLMNMGDTCCLSGIILALRLACNTFTGVTLHIPGYIHSHSSTSTVISLTILCTGLDRAAIHRRHNFLIQLPRQEKVLPLRRHGVSSCHLFQHLSQLLLCPFSLISR